MFYLTSLVMLIFAFALKDTMLMIAAGLFAIAGAIELHK